MEKSRREWFKLGHVTRDMQVIIEESDNQRPTIEILDPICVEAGTLIKDTVLLKIQILMILNWKLLVVLLNFSPHQHPIN